MTGMSFHYLLIFFAIVSVLCYMDDCNIYSEGCVAISRTVHWIPCSEIYKLTPLQTLYTYVEAWIFTLRKIYRGPNAVNIDIQDYLTASEAWNI